MRTGATRIYWNMGTLTSLLGNPTEFPSTFRLSRREIFLEILEDLG